MGLFLEFFNKQIDSKNLFENKSFCYEEQKLDKIKLLYYNKRGDEIETKNYI